MVDTRTIYNQTGDSWHIVFRGGEMINCPGIQPGELMASVTLPANATVNLVYIAPLGDVEVTSPNGAVASWSWINVPFKELEIQHSGDTQGVNLNTPAGGDMQLWGNVG